MKLPPAMVEELVTVARAAQAAPRGGKEAVYAAAAQRLGLSRATLLRHLHSVAVRPQRKRRADPCTGREHHIRLGGRPAGRADCMLAIAVRALKCAGARGVNASRNAWG